MSQSQDYAEILFLSVDALLENRLRDIAFDKTIVCEIIDDANKSNGVYIVSDGSVTFEAVCDTSNKYIKGESVYVTIPQGNYDNTKLIISRYAKETANQAIAYIPSLGTMLMMTNNICPNEIGSFGITANGNVTMKKIWSVDLTTNQPLSIKNNSIYNTLGLQASFKTLFNKDIVQGSYGLILELIYNKGGNECFKWAQLDTLDMFGNPYKFMSYFHQEKKFDISEIDENITKMSLYLYQESNFKYYDENNNLINYPIVEINHENIENILVSNIQVLLGDDLLTVEDNTFKLYCYDGQDYDKTNYKKSIYSTWYNKDDNNTYIGFTDGIVDMEYDEDAYYEKYNSEMKGATLVTLEKGIPNIKEALQIYANTKSLTEYYTQLKNHIHLIDTQTTDLKLAIVSFDSSYDKRDEIYTIFDNTIKDPLIVVETFLNDALGDNGIEPSYINWLKSHQEIYDLLTKNIEAEVEKIAIPNIVTANNILKDLKKAIVGEGGLYPELYAQLQEWKNLDALAYIKSYESKYNQIAKYIEEIELKINDLMEQQNILCVKFQSRMSDEDIDKRDITLFEDELAAFNKQYANRYCIYWYKYNAGYTNENERYLSANWERLLYPTDGDGAVKTPKPGMPSLDVEDPPVYKDKSETPYENLELDITRKTEKIKAVLIFNHVVYESNELEFTNLEDLVDNTTADLNALQISHGVNSRDHYQLYGAHNCLLNSAEAYFYRQLNVAYNGVQETGIDALKNCYIYWYIPNNASMLSYDNKKLINEGFSDLSAIPLETNDEQLKSFAANKKNGYTCFYKQISSEADLVFYYLIKNYYLPTAINNKIICRVIKNDTIYEDDIFFTFATFGTSGTDYTLEIAPAGTQTAVYDNQPLTLQALFTDYQGKAVKDNPVINWEIINLGAIKSFELSDIDGSLSQKQVQVMEDFYPSYDSEHCLYHLVECTVQWDKLDEDTESAQQLTLKKQYPVAYAKTTQENINYYIEGASTVIYDNLGKSPSYYKGAYKLFDSSSGTEIKNITWDIYHYDRNGQLIDKSSDVIKYLPKIKKVYETNNEGNSTGVVNYYLQPLAMYVGDSSDFNKVYSVVVCKNTDKDLLWAQPLIIEQYHYGSSLLNSWDESLTIDKENGIILSTMVGAGFKDGENKFSGVLMGSVGPADGVTTTVSTGLYGFNKGAQSFGFKDDGTAFIGKSGEGRIEFDGRGGYIASANWLNPSEADATDQGIIGPDGSLVQGGPAGMAIGLRQGWLDAHNFKLTARNDAGVETLVLNSNPVNNTDYYLKLGDSNSSDGFISFTKQGNLEIKVNNFQMTSVLGGTNLLLNTEPKEKNGYYDPDDNSTHRYDPWKQIGSGQLQISAESAPSNKTYYFHVTKGSGDNLYWGIKQSVRLAADKQYTISGWLYRVVDKQRLAIQVYKGTDTDPFDTYDLTIDTSAGWKWFSHTFTTTEEDSYSIRFYSSLRNELEDVFNDDSEKYLKIWHPKLEEGTIATTWDPAPQDIDSGILEAWTSIEQNAHEISLKASQMAVDELDERLITAESSIKVNAHEISLKASQTTVDKLDNRLVKAESSIKVNADNIALKVSQSTFNELTKEVDTISSTIEQMPHTISMSVTGGNGVNAGISISLKDKDGNTIGAPATGTIKMTGLVTFDNLKTKGTTTINGSNITTGVINADLITTGELSTSRITGDLCSGEITIGGWTIDGTSISTGTFNSINGVFISSVSMHKQLGSFGSQYWRTVFGSNFGITTSGEIYAQNAHIQGKIEAGGWIIGDSIKYGSDWQTDDAIAFPRKISSSGEITELLVIRPYMVQLMGETLINGKPGSYVQSWENILHATGLLGYFDMPGYTHLTPKNIADAVLYYTNL